jgi:hypothetical protein
MTSEKIIFYAMNGCGHCDNAKEALAEEINSGKIKVLSNFEAPYGVQGFPHFVNTVNKRTCTGWPGSKNNLLEKLDCVELFSDDDIDAFFKVKEDFPASEPQNPCYQDCWKNKGGDGIQKSKEWSTNLKFRHKYEECKDNCDISAKAVIPTATLKSREFKYQDCLLKCKKEGFSENFEMESVPSYPVVNYMETIPPVIHYYHHTGGGYSKLSNCWVKQPNFTA